MYVRLNKRLIGMETIVILTMLFILTMSTDSYSIKLIRFATLAPEGSTWMETMRALDAEIREASGGEVGFKLYPNMAMGDEKDVILKIKLGQVNAAGFTGLGLGEILSEVRILELPYIFSNEDEIDYTLNELDEYYQKAFEEKGFYLLGWADVGWVYFLANEPVAEPKLLKGLNVWTWQGDPLAEAFFKELKKTPIPLPVTDVHLSIQTGMIDAVYCSPLAALVLQWFTKLSYISDIPFTYAVGAVLVDKKTLDNMEPRYKEIVIDRSRVRLRELVLKSRKDNRDAYQELIKQGMQVVPSNRSQRTELRRLGTSVQDRLVGTLYTQDFLERIRKLLKDYRDNKDAGIDN